MRCTPGHVYVRADISRCLDVLDFGCVLLTARGATLAIIITIDFIGSFSTQFFPSSSLSLGCVRNAEVDAIFSIHTHSHRESTMQS